MKSSLPYLICVVSVVLSGCSEPPGPKADVVDVVAASGTVTFKGKPLEGFMVTFMPTSGQRPGTAVTDSSGKFTLGTNEPGDGAAPGTHKVAVTWAGPGGEDDPTASAIDDPSKLPKPPVQIPAKYASFESSGITQEIPSGGTDQLQIILE